MTEINQHSLNLESKISTPEARLDNERMTGLITGAGNHASKLVLLAAMKPEVIYGLRGNFSAYNVLKASQYGSALEGWLPAPDTPFKYLADSLAPIGLVAKEFINENGGTIGYQLTNEGQRVGVPLAGHLLSFAEHNNLALSQLFGDTTSRNPNARAGELRWKVFQGLATQNAYEEVSVMELAASVEVDANRVVNNLPELAKIGVLQYEPGTKRQPQTYSIDLEGLADRLPSMRTERSVDIARLIIESGLSEYSVARLAERTTEESPDANTPAFRSTLKAVLMNWENTGIAKRVVQKSGDSRVWVTEEQQSLLQELTQILEDIKAGDENMLEQGRELASEILSSPDRVSKLLVHEKEVSVHYHGQENARKRGARILDILRNTGTEMTYEEIRQQLEKMGDIVSVKGISRIIKDRNDVIIKPDQSRRGDYVGLIDGQA
jgi:hypothetical protein